MKKSELRQMIREVLREELRVYNTPEVETKELKNHPYSYLDNEDSMDDELFADAITRHGTVKTSKDAEAAIRNFNFTEATKQRQGTQELKHKTNR